MRLFKVWLFSVLFIPLFLNQVQSDIVLTDATVRRGEDAFVEGISLALMFIPPPAGAILSIATNTFYQIFNLYRGNKKVSNINTVSNNYDFLLQQLSNRMEKETKRLIAELPDAIHSNQLLTEMRESIDKLDKNYTKCFITKRSCPKKIKDFIENSLENPESQYRLELSKFVNKYIMAKARQPLDKLFKKPQHIFDIIVNQYKDKVDAGLYCGQTESMQTQVFDFSMYLLLVLVKSFTLVTSAHMRHYYKAKNPLVKMQWYEYTMDLVNDFKNDIALIVDESQRAINEVSRDIRPCDSKKHIRGFSYEMLTNFIQAQLYADPTSEYQNKCYGSNIKQFSASQDNPNIVKCEAKKQITGVYTEEDKTERLYHHLTFELEGEFLFQQWNKNYAVYGDNFTAKGIQLKREFYRTECGIFYCLIDQKYAKQSVRRFSLRQVSASPGYVVTGVQWVLKENTVFLEIQEGLFVNGTVDPTTVRWKETTADFTRAVILTAGERSLSLDEAALTSGAVVTAVKMIFENGMLSLNVAGHELDSSGMNLSTWKSNIMNMSYEREEINLEDFDSSEYSPRGVENLVLSEAGKHIVKFQPTSFQHDAAQTTIPYLDIQPVITNPPSPIGGIGIYYKGLFGYGGYVGLKLMSVDVSHILEKKKYHQFFNIISSSMANKYIK